MNTAGQARVAVITGGAQGIGKAIALRMLKDGACVVIADLDEEAGRETEAECAPSGTVRFVRADVANESDVLRLADETLRAFGGVDLLVNNAAISRGTPLTRLSLEDWNRVLAVNLTAPFLCAKHLSPFLKARRGAIINIASTRAFMSEANTEAYSASKGGIVALTHALAVSLGPEIRVNCISPGWIETGSWRKRSARRTPVLSDADHAQHPAGRVGQPDDIAELVAYLASPRASFITGANHVVDGGMTRKMIYV
jgi:NAD(P)-dependent dehydrogenase (short-subunit alcohol dehydrogenase family)